MGGKKEGGKEGQGRKAGRKEREQTQRHSDTQTDTQTDLVGVLIQLHYHRSLHCTIGRQQFAKEEPFLTFSKRNKAE